MKLKYDILVVDDAQDWRARLIRLANGFSILPVENFIQAEEALKKYFFYCALIDQSLDPNASDGENKDGLEVVKTIAQHSPETRAYMVTAYGDPDIAFRVGKDYRIDGYIQKTNLNGDLSPIKERIKKSVLEAKDTYNKKHSHALSELTKNLELAENTDENRAVFVLSWQDNATRMLSDSSYKFSIQDLDFLLNHLLKGYFPLLPLKKNFLPAIEPLAGIISAKYWSKAIGQEIEILILKESNSILLQKYGLASENPNVKHNHVIGYINHLSGSFGNYDKTA